MGSARGSGKAAAGDGVEPRREEDSEGMRLSGAASPLPRRSEMRRR